MADGGVETPGMWWRVLDLDGELRCQTNVEAAARAAVCPGDRLQWLERGEQKWEDDRG